jgi:hypothetical protein
MGIPNNDEIKGYLFMAKSRKPSKVEETPAPKKVDQHLTSSTTRSNIDIFLR